MASMIRLICCIVILFSLAYLAVIFLRKRRRPVINEVPDGERIEVLRKYARYRNVDEKVLPTKLVLNRKAPDLLQRFQYEEFLAGFEPESDDLAFGLLDFVCSHFHHFGDAVLPPSGRRGIADLIRSCEAADGYTNCRGLSLILAELLRMNNIKARHVTCMPYEEPFTDCPVVVDCILPSGKRVMLDPTYRLYITDEQGEYVSLEQFREGMIAGAAYRPSPKASYNGGGFNLDDYLKYMSKNLFRFSANVLLDDSKSDLWSKQIELIPEGYPVKGFPANRKFVYHPRTFWDFDQNDPK